MQSVFPNTLQPLKQPGSSKHSTVPLSGVQITLTAAVPMASSPLSKLISHTRCSLAEAQVSKQVNLLTIPKT